MLSQSGRAKRILVVDDESTLIFFLKKDLEEMETAFHVEIASSGEDALKKLTYNRYDLLVTDLNMPGISGFTLAEVARSMHPDIRIILMTAFGSQEVRAEANNLMVDGYLTKPFPTAQLRELVYDTLITNIQDNVTNPIAKNKS
ncbi:MAG: response regulator [Anaerolineae bacterium]|nr:response regulator [Anaerolineae bacterium]